MVGAGSVMYLILAFFPTFFSGDRSPFVRVLFADVYRVGFLESLWQPNRKQVFGYKTVAYSKICLCLYDHATPPRHRYASFPRPSRRAPQYLGGGVQSGEGSRARRGVGAVSTLGTRCGLALPLRRPFLRGGRAGADFPINLCGSMEPVTLALQNLAITVNGHGENRR